MKKTHQKPKIVNTFSIVKGEAISNFGSIKPRFDSEQNELPCEISSSARKIIDAYSNDESVNLAYDAEKNEVRIVGKCTGGRIKLS